MKYTEGRTHIPAQHPPSPALALGPQGNDPEAEPDAARGTHPRQQRPLPPVPAAGGPGPRRNALAEARPAPSLENCGWRVNRHCRGSATRSGFSATDGYSQPARSDSRRRHPVPRAAISTPGAALTTLQRRPEVPVSPPKRALYGPAVLQLLEVPVNPPEIALYGPAVLQNYRKRSKPATTRKNNKK